MNYLAHLFLSFKDPDLMLGNFIADNIRLAHIKSLSKPIQLGVALHRKIDEYTDNHISFIKASELLRIDHGRYSTVVIDIINDHLLCQAWDSYSNESISHFNNYVYKSFSDRDNELRGSAKKHLEQLLQHRYLHVYQSKEGLKNVMMRMDKRTKFPSNFQSSVGQLYSEYDFYFHLFNDLFSDLIINLDRLLSEAKESIFPTPQSEMKK